MTDFEAFRDHFVSLYQSAVADIAFQLNDKARALTPVSRATFQRQSALTLPNIAASIAADEFAARHGLTPPPRLAGPRSLTKVEIGRVCAELAMRYLKARFSGDPNALAQVNSEFITGTCDPAWASTISEYAKYFGPRGERKEIPYIRAAAIGKKVIEIKSDARIAIAGDWGTGTQSAIEVLKQIASERPDIFIHLGDIYYSGTPAECKSNFLDPVNQLLRPTVSDTMVYTLSGNHDMYCGGVGYYELIKQLNPVPFAQPASFFCLRSSDERWQFLAIDTGIHDYSPLGVADAMTYVEPDELEWHSQRIEEFPGRTILLSHHQLFSAYSAIGPAKKGKLSAVNPKLLEAFTTFDRSEKISAWFWGHEHTLSIYEPFVGLKRGRCLGHGAVPTSIADDIYRTLDGLEQVPREITANRLKAVGGVYAHGYALLSLNTNLCLAEYYQSLGGTKERIFEEHLD